MSIKFDEEDRERLNDVQNCSKRKVYSFTDTMNYSTFLQKKILTDFDKSIENIHGDINRLVYQNKTQYFLNLIFAVLLLILSVILVVITFR